MAKGSTTGTDIHVPAILHSTMQAKSNILLKTAIAQVSAQSYSTCANILFDKGAQRLFITEQLTKKLHKQHTGSDTISVPFAGSTHKCHSIPT